jgi:hypothetical protein
MNNIIFDEDMEIIEDISFDLEEKIIREIPKPIKKVEPRNRLDLTSDETETVIAVIIGVLFFVSFLGSLCGYSYWYMNIK